MKERYLYRAKRTDNGEWVEGYLYRLSENHPPFIMLSDRYGESHEVDPSTICQCTGRNNEWEHDIFQYDDERYEIQFCEDSLTWEAVSVFSSESIELGEFSPSEYVRLGNSIDNSELLEVGE